MILGTVGGLFESIWRCHETVCRRIEGVSVASGVMSKVYRTELTPLSFLERSSIVFPAKTTVALKDGEAVDPEDVQRR